jgi:Rrf2 family iron-sulfur cluster assembly transcriptional regulator
MRITTKGRYALRAVLALAETSEAGHPVSIKRIAEKEDISAEFLEQIFFRLRRAGVIGSVRGPGGGFFFARPLAEISLLDIIEASGEGMGIAPCSCGKQDSCDKEETCTAGKVWREMDSHLRSYVESTSIEAMLAQSLN